MKRSELIKFLILRTIGNFLVLFAIFGFLTTFGPALYYQINYQIVKTRGIHYVIADQALAQNNSGPQSPENVTLSSTPKSTAGIASFTDVLFGAKEQVLTAPDTEFSIVIPKIGATSRVFPNIDSGNPDIYLPILLQGVAHAAGTVFPGMNGNIYMFAHSTDNFWDVGRYNAVFYLLKDLKVGDEIVIFFQNKRYNYIVSESKIVNPDDVSHITNAQNTGVEQLILQTCWPPGTAWQRLLIFARPK